jgi:hypothetical protein
MLHVTVSWVTDRFIPYATRMNATEKSLRNNDKTATNPTPFSTQQLTRWIHNAHITCNRWKRDSLYDPSVQYIREHQNRRQSSYQRNRHTIKQFSEDKDSVGIDSSTVSQDRRLKWTAVIREERWTSGVATSRKEDIPARSVISAEWYNC